MNIDEMPAGPELDRLVAEKVMGWAKTFEKDYMVSYGDRCVSRHQIICDGERIDFKPSSDVSDAWEAVIAMSQRKDLDCRWWNMTAGSFLCIDIGEAMPMSLARIMHDHPEKMPLAICRAALRAVGP